MAKSTPINNMIEMKKQYIPLPKIDAKKKKLSKEYSFIVPQNNSLPCGPIPDCNTIKVEQVLGFCDAVNDCVTAGVQVVSDDANNIITAGSDNGAFLAESTIDSIINNNTIITNIQNDITNIEGDITNIENDITNIEGDILDLQGKSHVPATVTGNGIVTSVASGTDNQSFQLGFNIGQLPSGDSNNQVVLGSDGKLFVAQTTVSTSGFSVVATIADRNAQTVADGHITQVTTAIDPNDNGFYIFDTATSSWTELVPNATVISVNGSTGAVVLIPSDLAYVATINGNSVTNVQEAIDELVSFVNAGQAHNALTLDTGNNPALILNSGTQKIKLDITLAGSYSNSTSGLTSTSIQGAIDEIDANVDALDIRIDNLESAGFVESVTGNIVDNTDPINPIITQVQSDWQQTNNTQIDFIKNKIVRPDQLGGTTTNSKIVVRDTNGTFRDATAADITALGIGGFNPILLGYHQITGGGTQSVNIPVPPLTKIINVYGDRISGDLTGTMFRGGIISTWGDNPAGGVSGVSWNIVVNTLSGMLYVPNLQTITFEFIG